MDDKPFKRLKLKKYFKVQKKFINGIAEVSLQKLVLFTYLYIGHNLQSTFDTLKSSLNTDVNTIRYGERFNYKVDACKKIINEIDDFLKAFLTMLKRFGSLYVANFNFVGWYFRSTDWCIVTWNCAMSCQQEAFNNSSLTILREVSGIWYLAHNACDVSCNSVVCSNYNMSSSVVSYGVECHGKVWCIVVRYVVWYNINDGRVWYHWYGVLWCDLACYDMVWYDVYDMARYFGGVVMFYVVVWYCVL